MRAHFFVPPSPDEIFTALDTAYASLQVEYQATAKSFRYSVDSALSTVAMPFRLASSSIHQSHFQRIHTAERIRVLDIATEEIAEASARVALEKAQERMRDFVESESGRNQVIRDISRFLLDSISHGLEPAPQELLQQGLVLIWSAFEVLCRDTFETLLNLEPVKARSLVAHPDTRKRFEAERLSLETLVQYHFDLSARLGTVLVGQQDFSKLQTAKAVLPVLFPDRANLNEALADRNLWILCQRRHLIVHRRGIVDEAYVDATGDSSHVGTRLSVNPNDFENSIRVVVAFGTALLGCLSA
jgi:hypothetical protein